MDSSEFPERKRSDPPVRRKNEDVRAREWITEEEVEKLRKTVLKNNMYGDRDAAMILLGFRHGLRVSELTALRWEQIDFDERTIYVRRLKGSKPAKHTMELDEIRALKRLGRNHSGLVFVSHRGARIGRRAFLHIIATAGRAAKLQISVHPHMLRHACGYELAKGGYTTRAIQDWLGHSNIQHTVKYTALDPERFRFGGKGMWAGRTR